ncbi:hypothetical protein VPNG_07307 [Cytospora leucostoma]|uniref:Cytochrome P450 n=1 Tax=Cytospora leucostoma TaxID=1230097 RepID=A0A423WKL0_9PEZI|nr:hypothetical protein VPNG_07307 [Cytospora leucostoma]
MDLAFVRDSSALQQVLVGLILLTLLFNISRALYNILGHPLASLPGPKFAGATPFWLLYHTFRLRKCEVLDECLSRYGPVVRIAPNKVLISSQTDIKTVYGIGAKFVKSDFYPPWGLDGASNIFSTTDPKDHSLRRAITARTFSKNSIVKFMPKMEEHAVSLVRNLRARCDVKDGDQGVTRSTTTVEFLKMARYMALDMLGSSVLGEDFQLLKTGREHPFVHDLDSATLIIPTRATVPSWLWATVFKHLPVARWQHHLGGEARLSEYARETVHRAFAAADGAGGKADDRPPTLVSSYANYEDETTGRHLSTERIVGEIAAVYFAGTDTTSNTLTFAMYEIARRPDVQQKLRDEVVDAHRKARRSRSEATAHAVTESDDGVLEMSHAILENCPYLEAFISESLRLYAAIPSHLERVVPQAGVTLSTGHKLPAGTVIGVQTYSLHRDPVIFPQPHHFDPDRWLRGTPEMRKALSPWGFGSRICMGMHLAYIEFRLVIAAVVANFLVCLPQGFDHDTMDMKNLWFVFPQGGKLDVDLTTIHS